MPEGIRDTSAQDVRIEQSHHRWRWLRWALPLAALTTALILLVSVLATWLDAEASVSSDRIRTAQVSLGDLVRDLNVQGRVVAAVSPTLYSPATGTVTLEVQPGDAVENGQALAMIDSPGLRAAHLQEQSTLDRLNAELEREKIQARKAQVKSRQTIDLAQVKLTAAEREMRDIRGRDIGMIFQEPMTSLNPVLTVERQLTETLEEHLDVSREAARDRAVFLLEKVGITAAASRLKQYPHQLSGGLRQRVMIAMGLMCAPALIIADEPTTALDVTIQAQILDLLVELGHRRGVGLIFITHNIAAVAQSIREYWDQHGRGDKLLLSFHCLPKQNLLKGGPYHCQCHKSARLVAEAVEADVELLTDAWHDAGHDLLGDLEARGGVGARRRGRQPHAAVRNQDQRESTGVTLRCQWRVCGQRADFPVAELELSGHGLVRHGLKTFIGVISGRHQVLPLVGERFFEAG